MEDIEMEVNLGDDEGDVLFEEQPETVFEDLAYETSQDNQYQDEQLENTNYEEQQCDEQEEEQVDNEQSSENHSEGIARVEIHEEEDQEQVRHKVSVNKDRKSRRDLNERKGSDKRRDKSQDKRKGSKDDNMEVEHEERTRRSQKRQKIEYVDPRGGSSQPSRKADTRDTRERRPRASRKYFIIRSTNMENVWRSFERGIWATQVHNEETLERAFNNTHRVILIFSVNQSHAFQGFAYMSSAPGMVSLSPPSKKLWVGNPVSVGQPFAVDWQCFCNMPYDEVEDLHNYFNPDEWGNAKPVSFARDGQKVPTKIGDELCKRMKRYAKYQNKGELVPLQKERQKMVDENKQEESWNRWQIGEEAEQEVQEVVQNVVQEEGQGQGSPVQHYSLERMPVRERERRAYRRRSYSPIRRSRREETSPDVYRGSRSRAREREHYRSLTRSRSHSRSRHRNDLQITPNPAPNSHRTILDMTYEEYNECFWKTKKMIDDFKNERERRKEGGGSRTNGGEIGRELEAL
eukprot:TRINITY_DN49284_c0_g1_i10.p1 TRINITY_DN49284_c0_g1~~TRINITY_DN49284_c0_g1_i10.p1  ORF type:complete len:543 (+),score=93.97 TRINITY_DN49284_c0_g1_i10:78-1631(+)